MSFPCILSLFYVLTIWSRITNLRHITNPEFMWRRGCLEEEFVPVYVWLLLVCFVGLEWVVGLWFCFKKSICLNIISGIFQVSMRQIRIGFMGEFCYSLA